MFVYHYNTEGLYLGFSELNDSDKSLVTGEYLVPAWATTIIPPDPPEGKQAYFVNGIWELRDIPITEPPLVEPI
jgi:hypothetical protein